MRKKTFLHVVRVCFSTGVLLCAYSSAFAEDYVWNTDQGGWDDGLNWVQKANWTPALTGYVPNENDIVSVIEGRIQLSLAGKSRQVRGVVKDSRGGIWRIGGDADDLIELRVGTIETRAVGDLLFRNGDGKGGLAVEAVDVQVISGALYFGAKSHTISQMLSSLNITDGIVIGEQATLHVNMSLPNSKCWLGSLTMGAQATVNLYSMLKDSSTSVVKCAGINGGGVVQSGWVGKKQSADVCLELCGDSSYVSFAILRDNPDAGKNEGSLNLMKSGSGTQVMASSSTYSGYTIVKGGEYYVNGTHAGGSRYEVGGGGVLGGVGSIDVDKFSVKNGGSISPGEKASSIGVLTINAREFDFSEASAGAFRFDLAAGGNCDKIKILGKHLNIGALVSDKFKFMPGAGFGPGKYVLFEAASEMEGTIAPSMQKIGRFEAVLSFDATKRKIILVVGN